MADKMKAKLNEQIKSLIATAYDVLDMWVSQVDTETSVSLTTNYPKHLPEFGELILDLQRWKASFMEEESIYELIEHYTSVTYGQAIVSESEIFVCSCDNEISMVRGSTLEDARKIVCHNCGSTEYWIPESEIDADEVLIQDIK